MTPIQDYAYHMRQRLIKDKRSAAQMHYQELIRKGLNEDDAANMSGWHPMIPVDKFLRRFAWTMVIGSLVILLGLYASTTAANMENKDKVKELTHLEHNVTWCMQGKPMKIGTEWFKCTCLSSDDPKGCPKEE